jgi:putative transposase
MDACFCDEALSEVLSRCGKPKVFNTDQGSPFTSFDFIERLWRSLNYEAVYLHELTDGFKAHG